MDFIPERFDPSSDIAKTPKGNKRHPCSYSPFMGGKRICLGKTFAELFSKILLSLATWNYDMEFVDKEHYDKRPLITMGLDDIKVKVHIANRK